MYTLHHAHTSSPTPKLWAGMRKIWRQLSFCGPWVPASLLTSRCGRTETQGLTGHLNSCGPVVFKASSPSSHFSILFLFLSPPHSLRSIIIGKNILPKLKKQNKHSELIHLKKDSLSYLPCEAARAAKHNLKPTSPRGPSLAWTCLEMRCLLFWRLLIPLLNVQEVSPLCGLAGAHSASRAVERKPAPSLCTS